MRDHWPDPPPELELPSGRLEQRRSALFGELSANRRRFPRPLLFLPVVGLVVAGGAAAAGVFGGGLAEPNRVHCYAQPSLRAEQLTASVGSAASGSSARTICAPFYERGGLVSERGVPELAACLDDGVVRVFPGAAQTCVRLGLEPMSDAEYVHEVARLRGAFELANAELARLGGATVIEAAHGGGTAATYGGGCAEPATAREVIQRKLAASGYDEFRVQTAPAAIRDECAMVVALGRPFDGRTFALQSPGVDAAPGVDAWTREEFARRYAAQERGLARICAAPYGKRAARRPQAVTEALICRERRRKGSEEAACFSRGGLRRFVRRVLRHQRLRGWTVVVEGGPPAGSSYELGFLAAPWDVDQRIRQVRLRLSMHCADHGTSAPPSGIG